jgi:hypothetical protein
MNATQSEVILSRNGTTFSGPDAVNLMRAITLASSLRLYAKTGLIPTRGITASVLLRIATEYTGKIYKRGQHEQAAADIRVWIDTMKAALPITLA